MEFKKRNLNLKGWNLILMPTGNSPEIVSQQILVGIILVRRLGVVFRRLPVSSCFQAGFCPPPSLWKGGAACESSLLRKSSFKVGELIDTYLRYLHEAWPLKRKTHKQFLGVTLEGASRLQPRRHGRRAAAVRPLHGDS